MFPRVWSGVVTVVGWVPLSGLGLLALIATLPLVRFLAVPGQDLVLLALGLGYLFLQALMSTLVLVRALMLRWQLRSSPAVFPDGAEAERPYWLPSPVSLWGWIPFVQVYWRWRQPDLAVRLVKRDGRWLEEVVLPRRGDYRDIEREYTVSDLLGLARIRFRHRRSGDYRVIPGLGQLSQQPLMIRWGSGDEVSDPRGEASGDRVDIRQYTRGDSPRTILWKVYARTRRLMVRVPERALAAKPKVCAYLVTGPRDEAAAALCRAMLEGNLLGPDWRFGCDGAPGQDHNKEAALERICRSAQSRRPEPAHLADYLHNAERDGYAQSIVVLPLDLAGRGLEVRDQILRSVLPVHLCLAIDGQRSRAVPNWQRWIRRDTENDQLQDQLHQAAQLWKNFPRPISVVDRQSGALLGDLQAFLRRSAG